jgi:flagellar basal-body rod protein FlgC
MFFMTLNQSMNIAHSALSAHSQRMQIHAMNIANLDTPYYTRKIPILAEHMDQPNFQDVLGSMGGVFKAGVMKSGGQGQEGGVHLPGIVLDPTPTNGFTSLIIPMRM